MANRITYELGCGRGESFDFSSSPYNDVSGNGLAYGLGNCEFACLTGDLAIFDPGGDPVSIESIDVYGAIGTTFLWGNTPSRGFLQQCEFIVYCNGPVDESVPMSSYADRYSTRWVAKIQNGRVYYGKVGGLLQQVSELLIPNQDELTELGFCFDANARPCFSSQVGDYCYIWRWQAGTPQEYSFEGSGPKLFFIGELQPDNSLWDVACYYCFDGELSLAMQRDNFGVRYPLYSGASFSRVVHVGRGSGSLSNRLYIACATEVSGFGVFKTPAYPLWPLFVREAPLSVSATPAGGTYYLTTVALPPASDSINLSAMPAGGEYLAIRITLPTVEESIGVGAAPAIDGNRYWLVRVNAGTYDDSIGVAAAPAPDGNRYWLVRISAGTYSDDIAVSATPAGGTYAPV